MFNFYFLDIDGKEDEFQSDAANSEGSLRSNSLEFDCVICGQTSPSTDENPVGLVCLLQASSGKL